MKDFTVMVRRGALRFILVILTFFLIFGPTDLNALDSNLRINVMPGNITFNILNPDPLPQYYQCNQQVIVQTRHTVKKTQRQWYVGIKAAGAFLINDIDPANQIPVTRLHWSSDGVNYHVLTEQWQFVNTYTDRANHQHRERIYYRLYPDQIYSAGQYSVQINFDARWSELPW